MPQKIRIVGASKRNRRIIKMLLRDMKAVFGPYLGIYDSLPINIQVGHRFFRAGEEEWGAWHQNDDITHTIAVRPNLRPGETYTYCMHELGHAMGMAHEGSCPIMKSVVRVGKTQRLTRKRRIEWVSAFSRSVARHRVK